MLSNFKCSPLKQFLFLPIDHINRYKGRVQGPSLATVSILHVYQRARRLTPNLTHAGFNGKHKIHGKTNYMFLHFQRFQYLNACFFCLLGTSTAKLSKRFSLPGLLGGKMWQMSRITSFRHPTPRETIQPCVRRSATRSMLT